MADKWDVLFAKEKCDDCGVQLKNKIDMKTEERGIIAFGKFLCQDCYEKNRQAFIDAYEWEEGKTDYEDTTVCPYCGNRDEDAWEMSDDEGETVCGRCDKTYTYIRNIEVTYSTGRIDKEGQ